MAKNERALLFLLVLLQVCNIRMERVCPSLPDKKLACTTDYDRTITCIWTGTLMSDHADEECIVFAEKKARYSYSGSCKMQADKSTPVQKNCSIVFEFESIFQSYHKLSIDLRCNPAGPNLISYTNYMPACHVKLDPPGKPDINSTSASWFLKVPVTIEDAHNNIQLQWKQEDVSWSDSSVQFENMTCGEMCGGPLNKEPLVLGKRYEARVRVQVNAEHLRSTWSDWGPSTSWVSPIGKTTQPSGALGSVLGVMAGMGAVALFLVVLHFMTDKTHWIYMIKRIKGPPLPDPGKSFLQHLNGQSWSSPYSTSKSNLFYSRPEDIVSVEVTSTVVVVSSCGPEAAHLEKMRSANSNESSSSSFSNPSYSHLSPPPPFSSLTAGNLEPCTADTPYGTPVVGQEVAQNMDEDRHREAEEKVLQLLKDGSSNNKSMLVISDYEKVEKPNVDRLRLPSQDSGMCSGEEVSQESLEADSITVTDEGTEDKEERGGWREKERDFQKLLESSSGIFGKGSIQVCSDYERVEALQADSPELHSVDSGISSGGEEQVSQEESLEDVDKSTESTRLLFPPPALPSCALPCSLPLLFNRSGPALSPALQPLPCHVQEMIALMSSSRSVEPSGDGYM